MSVAGSSTLIGSVGIGSGPTESEQLFVNGQSHTTGQALFDSSIAIGPGIQRETDIQGSALLVQVPITSTAASDVTFDVPKSLYTSTDITNIALTNKLVIDTKNHVVKPSIESNGANVSVGWDIGATGENNFNNVYGAFGADNTTPTIMSATQLAADIKPYFTVSNNIMTWVDVGLIPLKYLSDFIDKLGLVNVYTFECDNINVLKNVNNIDNILYSYKNIIVIFGIELPNFYNTDFFLNYFDKSNTK
jgi:hypothetical protein